jgi:hypothetical protein
MRQTVTKLLREYAQRSALRGDNFYRAKAYSRAADSLAALAVSLDRLVEDGRLTKFLAWARLSPTSSRNCTGPAPIRVWRSSKKRSRDPRIHLNLFG